jgi:DNA repair protein RecO (recombination protein O)
MAITYTATGINLKGSPLGESDRLLTVLTREYGLLRVVAPGARKSNSKLGGRSGLFVVNTLLISKGRSLDKIIQAETLESYPGLGQDLRKLTASQYIAELVLVQALSEHPQDELFSLLNEHLTRLDDAPASLAIACLTHAIYHFLAMAGVPPQVHECCISQRLLSGDSMAAPWVASFSVAAGGVVHPNAQNTVPGDRRVGRSPQTRSVAIPSPIPSSDRLIKKVTPRKAAESSARYPASSPPTIKANPLIQLTALDLALLQALAQPTLLRADGRVQIETSLELPELAQPIPTSVWLKLEHILRQYAEYQFDRPIRSARLIDTCFVAST